MSRFLLVTTRRGDRYRPRRGWVPSRMGCLPVQSDPEDRADQVWTLEELKAATVDTTAALFALAGGDLVSVVSTTRLCGLELVACVLIGAGVRQRLRRRARSLPLLARSSQFHPAKLNRD